MDLACALACANYSSEDLPTSPQLNQKISDHGYYDFQDDDCSDSSSSSSDLFECTRMASERSQVSDTPTLTAMQLNLESTIAHVNHQHACDSQNMVVKYMSKRPQMEINSMPNLHKVISRMNYLQKYICSPSGSVSLCDHNGGVVTSEDGAVKLTIPNGAIMDGDLVMFYFVTCLYGPYAFKQHVASHCRHDLASPYYWIGVSESYRFHKPINVEFEHYAVVTACDPSHFQLLSCEDDDESFTMRPVDYALNFKIQDGISWCTFQTNHFCSYCLSHHCHHDHQVMTRIGAFFLKPKNFQSLNKFSVEVWFSFTTNHCFKRNEKLYTDKGLVLDTDSSCIFEASSSKSSCSYFALKYDQCNDGWSVDHFRFDVVKTKDINFYNYYRNEEDLKALEDKSLFPPRFILSVQQKSNCNKDLNLTIGIALFKKTLPTMSVSFKMFVPISRDSRSSILQEKISMPPHCCKENEPELKDLTKYSTSISPHWKEIALHLDIPREKVDTIDMNYPLIGNKCYEVFNTWLQKKIDPCWCHFIQALGKVGLNSLAEKVKTHLTLSENTVNLYDLEKLLDNVPEPIITQLLSKYTAKVKVIEDTGHSDVRSTEDDTKKNSPFPKESNPSQSKAYMETTV